MINSSDMRLAADGLFDCFLYRCGAPEEFIIQHVADTVRPGCCRDNIFLVSDDQGRTTSSLPIRRVDSFLPSPGHRLRVTGSAQPVCQLGDRGYTISVHIHI